MTYPSNVSGSEEVNHAQLRAFVERIEAIDSEIKDRNDDKAALFGEVKSAGFDKRIVRKVVARRRMPRDKRVEEETIMELYWAAVGESA